MAEIFDQTEAQIPIFFKARKKFNGCQHAQIFYYIGYCSLFHYTFDTTRDMLHHCSSCKANTKSPTTIRNDVRNP